MNIYSVFYIEINAACIIILIIFYHSMRRNMVNDRATGNSRHELLRIMLWTAVSCISDIAYEITVINNGSDARNMAAASSVLYLTGFVLALFYWMQYVIAVTGFRPAGRKLFAILKYTPLAIFIGVAATNHMTHLLFTINEKNEYVRGEGIGLHWLITMVYLVISLLIAAKAFRKDRAAMKRRFYYPLVLFIIAPVTAGVLQIIIGTTPVYQMGLTISIILLCIANQNYDISTDKLTGIDNRLSLERYRSRLFAGKKQNSLAFFMIDLDGFKEINDRYGHLKGDYILRKMAQQLRNICDSIDRDAFLCRFGGDEFLVIFKNTEGINDRFRKMLEQVCEAESKESETVSASVGFAAGSCSCNEEFEQLMRNADKNMYSSKTLKRKAAGNGGNNR